MEEGNIGKRIKLGSMVDESRPVPSGTMGTITHEGGGVLNVNWDNGRQLGVIVGEDKYEILETEESK